MADSRAGASASGSRPGPRLGTGRAVGRAAPFGTRSPERRETRRFQPLTAVSSPNRHEGHSESQKPANRSYGHYNGV